MQSKLTDCEIIHSFRKMIWQAIYWTRKFDALSSRLLLHVIEKQNVEKEKNVGPLCSSFGRGKQSYKITSGNYVS